MGSMQLNRREQTLWLEGKVYGREDVMRWQQVRQTHAEVPLPFSTDLLDFLFEWWNDSPWMTVQTSGSTGVPKQMQVSKERMMQSARLTCEFLGLRPGDTALLCMNLRYIGAKMVVVRSLVASLNLWVRPASGHPLADLNLPFSFAAMVPLQVYNSLQVPEERRRLEQIAQLIIGGGAIEAALEKEIRSLPGAVYSTYGMTETLSHIALRRLNGPEATERYTPFASVQLSLATDDTLVIEAPLVCAETLHTRDMARLYPDGTFQILGRKDNVINSGGVKIQTEQVEAKLHPLLSHPFAITSVSDARLGEAVTLLITHPSEFVAAESRLREILSSYEFPKHILAVADIPQAGNGKINRAACKELARRCLHP